MNHLIDIWLFFCGGMGMLFAWWESRKGSRMRAMMLAGAWIIVMISMVQVMLRVNQNEKTLMDNQQLIKTILERLP